MKRFLFLISILAGAGLANAATTITALDQANFLNKIQVNHLLQGKDGATYAEERNLNKDLQTSEIVNLFPCKTLAGKHFFETALTFPISPKSTCGTIERRVKIISTLVNDSVFKGSIDDLLAQASADEQLIVELFSTQFRGASCPEEKQLEILRQMNSPMYGFSKYMAKNPAGRVWRTLNNYGTFALMALIAADKVPNPVFDVMIGKTGSRVYHGVVAGLVGYEIVNDYKAAFNKRVKLHALSDIIAITEQLETLCNQHNLDPQFKVSNVDDEKARDVIKNLKKSRYAQKTSYVFALPRVHTFLYDLYEKDKCLADLFACVGEIDACNAIATMMLEQQNKSNQFCFAKFIDHSRPMFAAKGFWNILVGTNAISNDLSESRNVIMSGHNAGGKTTAIRALLQNILLGQTFGVAAATEFEFTPFDVIHSYLNISDDLMGGLSLFASEVKRAQEISQKIASLAPGFKYFFALDELFTGTAGEQGEECAMQFIGNISKADQVQFIYATHFDRLKRFGDVSVECTNYHVNSVPKLANGQYARLPNGKLDYPFTVSPGASYDNIALEMAKDANLFGSSNNNGSVAAIAA